MKAYNLIELEEDKTIISTNMTIGSYCWVCWICWIIVKQGNFFTRAFITVSYSLDDG